MKTYVEEINRSGRFQARRSHPDGPIIVANSRQPFFDAARVFKAEGLSGTLEMWDAVRSYPRMKGDIDKLAGMTVNEPDRGRPRIGRWMPDSRFGDKSQTGK